MKKLTFIIAAVCSMAMTAVNAAAYSDVPKSHWVYNPIQSMTEKSIMQRYTDGAFAPEGTITRAKFIVVAMRVTVKDQLDPSTLGQWDTLL